MKIKFFERNGADMVSIEVDHTHTFEGIAGEEHKRKFRTEWLSYKTSHELPKKEAFEIKDGDAKDKKPKTRALKRKK